MNSLRIYLKNSANRRKSGVGICIGKMVVNNYFFDDLNDDISITDRRYTHNDIFTHLTKKN